MNSTHEHLRIVLAYLTTAAEPDHMYGHYHGGDPRLFAPSEEECSPEEIAAHKAACEAWERGERPDIPKACEPLREGITFKNDKGEEETIKAGTGLALYAPFGIGVNTWINDDAVKALSAFRDALKEIAPDVLADFDRSGLIDGALSPA